VFDCLIVEQSNIIYLLAKPEDTGKRSNFRSILANTTLYGIIKSNLQAFSQSHKRLPFVSEFCFKPFSDFAHFILYVLYISLQTPYIVSTK
jgi:hypothetical protein